jgi:heme-degrading monooxygenase HmoA
MPTGFAATPEPPYYAVILTSKRAAVVGDDGYAAMADLMSEVAAAQEEYLGVEGARGADGIGITVSYWRDEASIAGWRAETRHRAAQDAGRRRWYDHYEVRVAKVERAYGGPSPPTERI